MREFSSSGLFDYAAHWLWWIRRYLSPKFSPTFGESLGPVPKPYPASLSMTIFSSNSIGVRFLNAKFGLW